MKKLIILMMIITAVFIVGCVLDSVAYCPYCGFFGVSHEEDDVFKCTNSACGKKFGAKKIP